MRLELFGNVNEFIRRLCEMREAGQESASRAGVRRLKEGAEPILDL